MIKRINTKAQLKELARELKVRSDWHEPDEAGVTATVQGTSFDNAGFWGEPMYELARAAMNLSPDSVELWVTLHKNDEPVAEINLATLFAFACDTYSG